MKYIISESKLNSTLISFFEREMDPDNINYYYPLDTDEDDMEYDVDNILIFYKGNVDNEDIVFRYYYCEYFDNNSKPKCPLLDLEIKYKEKFNDLFGDMWIKPFRLWVNDVFDLNAKSVE